MLNKRDTLLISVMCIALFMIGLSGWMAYVNSGLKEQVKQLQHQNKDYAEGVKALELSMKKYQAEQTALEKQYERDTLRLEDIKWSFDSLALEYHKLQLKQHESIPYIIALSDGATDSLYAINKQRFAR